MSKKRKIAVAIIIVLIALTVAFIWSNSLKSQAESSESSGEIFNTIKAVLDDVFGEDVVPITHHDIRKAAHFSEFLLLGAEFCLLFIALNKESFKGYLHVLPCGLFVAAVDEGLQCLSDRGPAIIDVMIDFAGYLTSVAVFFIIFLIRLRAKDKRQQKNADK